MFKLIVLGVLLVRRYSKCRERRPGGHALHFLYMVRPPAPALAYHPQSILSAAATMSLQRLLATWAGLTLEYTRCAPVLTWAPRAANE